MADKFKVLHFRESENPYKQEIIEMLNEILKQVERGEVLEIMISCIGSDDTYATWYSGSADLIRVAGFLQRQLYLTNKRLDVDGEEEED